MKKKPPESTPCNTQAGRVQHWFSKDREGLLCWDKRESRREGIAHKHKCDPVKAARVPMQIQESVTKRKNRVGAYLKQMTHPQEFDATWKQFLTYFQDTIVKAGNKPDHVLSPSRVTYRAFREHFFASKRFKHLSKQQHTSTRKHQVVPILSEGYQQEPSSSQHPSHWNIDREQRHFQIDRIIKYLAD